MKKLMQKQFLKMKPTSSHFKLNKEQIRLIFLLTQERLRLKELLLVILSPNNKSFQLKLQLMKNLLLKMKSISRSLRRNKLRLLLMMRHKNRRTTKL